MKQTTIILFIVIITGCTQKNKVDNKAEGEKLMQISREWSQQAKAGNVEKTVSYWADDAVHIAAGQPTHTGKNAIRQMVEESNKIPGFSISWEPLSVEISESGDMGYLIEKSQVSYKDSTGKLVTQYNRAVTIWRKQGDGSWKNVVDLSVPEPSF